MRQSIVIIILILTFSLSAESQEHFFRQYSNESGLNHSFVYSINQDDQGYMWIGTAEGLYRFNGFDFEYFTVEDGLANNFITIIFKDGSGRLWFGHQNGNITVRNGDSFTALSERAEIQGSVTDISEDDQGIIWATAQNEGLVSINEEYAISEVSLAVDEETLSQIEYLGNDYFLLGTQESIFLSMYNREFGSMEILSRVEEYPGSKVVEILPENRNSYFILSQEEGLFYFKFDSLEAKYAISIIDENSDGMLDNLQGGILDETGALWLNTMGSGLVKYTARENGEYTRSEIVSGKNGLISDNVRSSFVDFEGNLWFGMYGEGLLRYVDDNLKFYSYTINNESARTYSITGDGNTLLAVTGNGLLLIDPVANTLVNSYSLPVVPVGDRVNSLYLSQDRKIWLGFEKAGLFVAEPTNFRFKPVFLSRDDLANSINSITGTEQSIWVATKRGVCRINLDTGNSTWFTTYNGLPHNNIQQLHIDSKGRVLVATVCSEIHYIDKDDKVEHIYKSRIGLMNSVISIIEGIDGTIWAATLGNGIWMIKDEGNVNYTRVKGLLSDFCYSISLTEEDKIVIGHRGGISQIDPQTNRTKTFSRLEGIKSSAEFYPNSIYNDIYGKIWFGTSEGLIMYNSNLSSRGLMPPKLNINALYVNGEKVDYSNPVSLKAGYYEVVIDYIGINFTNPEMVNYQTKLEGYNAKWSGFTDERRVIYDRVGHGDYSFSVRAFNENDIASELSSAFELHIKKPLFLTFWFYFVIIAVISFALFRIIRWREKSLRTVQERLLKNLDEKTKDIIVKEEIIKERKKIEKELIEAKKRAELSDKLKTSFLSNMSHEIRTPMNAIVGMSHLLKDEGFSEEERDQFVDTILINSESLLALIGDILDVSKLETDQLNIKKGPCNVNEMIRGLYSKYHEELENTGKSGIDLLTMAKSDDGLVIITDSARLKQVLIKLLDNAVKYTEEGSITFGYELGKNEITFFVEDTGIGLSEEKMEVIFDLFRKIEDDKLKLYRGTGLGLTLARYLVKLLGGEIHLESKENVGSKFYFVLPATTGSKTTGSTELKSSEKLISGNWSEKRILVVEDDESNYLLIEQILLSTGIKIDRATDGNSALGIFFNNGPFDLVLIDIKLPGIDGYEVTRMIRGQGHTLPIISHTAYAMEGDREKSLAAGCDEYIPKPTNRKKILNILSGYLDNPGS